jgi:dTDP-4-dehydrorhamnose reductase
MRVLVLGGEGMLGHQACRRLGPRFELWATYRNDPAKWMTYGNVPPERALGGVDAMAFEAVESALEQARPDAVINCIGIVKQRDEAQMAVPSIAVNSLFPHELADRCASMGARLLHISTDCVFSGRRGSYTEDDLPDPPDLYGRSKLLGEVDRSGCLTIRTSIIGWEVMGNASLLEWFASQRGQTIKGFRRVIYTGLSTIALADIMAWVLHERAGLDGLYQVASEPITKYDLLTRLRDQLGWHDITIEPDDEYSRDMSLTATRFQDAAGWRPPSWQQMIDTLATSWPSYASWRGAT